MLQQNVVNLAQLQDVTVVEVHEAFHAEPGAGIGKSQFLGQRSLMLELQMVLFSID